MERHCFLSLFHSGARHIQVQTSERQTNCADTWEGDSLPDSLLLASWLAFMVFIETEYQNCIFCNHNSAYMNLVVTITFAGTDHCCSRLFEDGREATCSSIQQPLVLGELFVYAWLIVCFLSALVVGLFHKKFKISVFHGGIGRLFFWSMFHGYVLKFISSKL